MDFSEKKEGKKAQLSPENHELLKNYIEKEIKKGFSEGAIKDFLEENGYRRHYLDAVFFEMREEGRIPAERERRERFRFIAEDAYNITRPSISEYALKYVPAGIALSLLGFYLSDASKQLARVSAAAALVVLCVPALSWAYSSVAGLRSGQVSASYRRLLVIGISVGLFGAFFEYRIVLGAALLCLLFFIYAEKKELGVSLARGMAAAGILVLAAFVSLATWIGVITALGLLIGKTLA